MILGIETKKVVNISARILSILFIVAFLLIFLKQNSVSNIDQIKDLTTVANAVETSCPEDMSDQACLDYLKNQSNELGKKQDNISEKLDDEKFKQLSLLDQINYLRGQISSRENKIKEIEIELETKNVEIRILNKDIELIQDDVDLIVQEINQLENTIGKRLTLSYKYSHISPLEMLFSSEDVDEVIHLTKYLIAAREKDQEMLGELADKRAELVKEQEVLAQKETEVRQKRDEIDEQKEDLYAEKSELAKEKGKQDGLLSRSKAIERQYKEEIRELEALKNEIDSQATALVMEMYNKGQLGNGTRVAKGQIIGFQGHTGCSYGSHLHFGMYSNPSRWWESNVNPYNGHLSYSGGYLRSSGGNAPQDSAWITQGFHQGYAIDTVSLTAGNQSHRTYGSCWSNPTSNQCYYVKKGSKLCGRTVTSNRWYPLRGEGAPIYSLYSGKVYYARDGYGAKIALVEHDNGLFSLYVHLRD